MDYILHQADVNDRMKVVAHPLIPTLWNYILIVVSVLLRYTDYDYPFGIFKLFLIEILLSNWYMSCI
jgi:hypothetical protein